MAYEIWETNSRESELVLIGIEQSGYAVAAQLARRLEAICSIRISLEKLKINKRSPLKDPIHLDAALDGKSIIIVDDVADSGRTLLFALKPLLEFEPKKVQIAVLVDRKHKSFPVAPDIIGYSLATTLQDHIEVTCEGEDILGAYLS